MSVQIDFQPPFLWQELNDQVDEILGVKASGGSVKVVAGIRQALAELTVGLAKQFPHKRKAYFFKGLDPLLEIQAATLAREGCSVQALAPELLKDPGALAAAFEPDALLVLASEDDPLLGRLYDLTHLEALAETKKLFVIRVSHLHHRFLPLPKTYSRFILHANSVSPRLALIVSSARVRWPIQFAESVALPAETMSEIVKLKSPEFINPIGVEKFEQARPAAGQPVFGPNDRRIPDRAVLFWPDMDGLALITNLAQRLGLKLPVPGEPTLLETTSLNRWRGVRTMDWLREFGFTDEMIRGTVIFDQCLFAPELTKCLEEARHEILAIQSGS